MCFLLKLPYLRYIKKEEKAYLMCKIFSIFFSQDAGNDYMSNTREKG